MYLTGGWQRHRLRYFFTTSRPGFVRHHQPGWLDFYFHRRDVTGIDICTTGRTGPQGGRTFAYTREGLGDFAGFLIAWGHWIAVWAGNAAICVAFVSYLTVFFPSLGTNPVLSIVVGLSALWGLSLVNIRGVHTAGVVQLVTTVLKILPLIAVSIVGLFYLNPDHFTPFNNSGESNFSAITACATLTLWAYLGLESATVPADNVDNPSVTIPRATIFGTLLCAVIARLD